MLEMGKRFQERFGRVPDHNGFKGYIGAHLVKAAVERVGALDQAKVRDCLHNNVFTTADEPGLLMDTYVDDKGDADRPSFIVEVKDQKSQVAKVLPAARGTLHQAGLPLGRLELLTGAAARRADPAASRGCSAVRGRPRRLRGPAPRPRADGPLCTRLT